MLNLLLITIYIASTKAENVTLYSIDEKDLGNKQDVGVVRDKLLWIQGQTGIVTMGKLQLKNS